jgi:hypothetical protein
VRHVEGEKANPLVHGITIDVVVATDVLLKVNVDVVKLVLTVVAVEMTTVVVIDDWVCVVVVLDVTVIVVDGVAAVTVELATTPMQLQALEYSAKLSHAEA